jgi:glycosyltransferase involved in cell wall biosynthesis
MTRKILFLVTEDWYFCSHRLPLAVAMKANGFEVSVVTRVRENGEQIRYAGLKPIPFELSRSGMNLLADLVSIVRLAIIYYKEKPDIIHHVAIKPVLYGTLVARLLGIHCVVNALAGLGWLFTSMNWQAKLLRPLVRFSFRRLLRQSTIIVQNPDDAAVLQCIGVAANRMQLIRGSGVDIKIYTPIPEPKGVPLIILPARMLWAKGVGEFVEAARLLHQQGTVARFALVGEPDIQNPDSVPLTVLETWQKTGIVEWWGQQNDMPQVYAQASIVCLPSYREGLPKSLLEAAACGRPIVTTDAPGCREIVHNGDNGFLVPVKDTTSLTNALVRLIQDPLLRQRMGERGRLRAVSEFSLEQVISRTLAVYQESYSLANSGSYIS